MKLSTDDLKRMLAEAYKKGGTDQKFYVVD